MKKQIMIIYIIACTMTLTAQQPGVSINEDGSMPNPSALLDIKSNKKGLLMPRMTKQERDSINNPAAGLMIYQTDDVLGFYYHSGTAWTPVHTGSTAPPPTVAIGDMVHGGIVFWVDPTDNTKGKVCAMTDQSIGAEWGCYSINVAGADALDNGLQNTLDILNEGCGLDNQTNSVAANICAAYRGGGYSDWFLPSKDELNQMYLNKATINATAIANGGSGFANSSYWSSTEYDFSNAWRQYFYNGSQGYYDKRQYSFYVRAVRAF